MDEATGLSRKSLVVRTEDFRNITDIKILKETNLENQNNLYIKEQVNEEPKKDDDDCFYTALYSEDGERLLSDDDYQDLMKKNINEIKARVTRNITLVQCCSEDEARTAINAYNLAPSTSDFWNDDDRKYFDENSITIESKGNGTFNFKLNNMELVGSRVLSSTPIITLNLNNAFITSGAKPIDSKNSSDLDKNDNEEGYKLELRDDSFSQTTDFLKMNVPKEFLNLINNLPKFKEEYEKLTDTNKLILYTNATLDNTNQQCMKLGRIISELSANDSKMEYVIDAISLQNDIIKETTASGQMRNPETITPYNDIYAEINGILELIEVYKNVRSRRKSEDETNVFRDFKLEILSFLYISERIQRLKLQLKSEPLEELRFLLINFKKLYQTYAKFENICSVESNNKLFNIMNYLNEAKVYIFFTYRHIDVLVESIYELGDKLTVIKREIEKDESFGKKIHLSSDKLKKIGQKVKNKKDFELVYQNYYIFRDVDSLEKVMNHMDVVKSVDLIKNGIIGKLIIQRALQAIGELLKNSESSPYLSEKTRNYLKKCNVPVKVLEELRSRLSHGFTLCKRINIEETDDNIFGTIKDEIETFQSLVDKVLNIVKCERTLWQLDKAHDYMMTVFNKTELISSVLCIIAEGKKVIHDYIDVQCKNLFTTDQYVDQYVGAIKIFSDKINERMPDCKLSDGFRRRLETLLNILDCNYVRSGVREMFSMFDVSSQTYERSTFLLSFYLEKDEKLLTAIEMLLLDLTTILTDMKLFLKEFVLQDVLLYFASWGNTSTRNHLGHEDALLSSIHSNAMLLNKPIKFFKKYKQEIISLVSLLDDYKIKEIIFKEINRNNFNEKWLKSCHDEETQFIINKHKDSIKTILNSADYYKQLSDLAKSESVFTCINRGTEKKVIELLNKNTDLDVNQEDEDGRTLLYYALSKKLYNVINKLLCKKANLNDQHFSIIKENKDLFEYIIKMTIRNNDIENFKIFDDLMELNSTHLNLATLSNSIEIIDYLLTKGVDSNIPDSEGNLPLSSAIYSTHFETVSLLLKNGARYNCAGKITSFELVEKRLTDYKNNRRTEKSKTKNEKIGAAISNLEKILDLLKCIDQLFQAVANNELDVVNSLFEEKNNDTLQVIFNARNAESKKLLDIADESKCIFTVLQDKIKYIQEPEMKKTNFK